uniref:Reverse transcriptase domain-containing protein n=1 Tax=Cacopsylla melanoneura TaxID=428564 RepID=A0A8D8YH58_9HEMI
MHLYVYADIRKWFFADDYRVACIISKLEHCLELQSAINDLVNWCELNRMFLNVDKSHVATFNRKKVIFEYTMNGNQFSRFSRTNNIKDLGVFLDQDLKFSIHHETIVNTGYRNLGFILRDTTNFNSPKTFKTLYCSLVRSSLEYASTVWSPSYLTHINPERSQNKFLRSLSFKDQSIEDNHNYKVILSKYEMNTLQHRRDVFDILFIVKLIQGQIQCPELLEQLTFRFNKKGTRNNDLFALKTYKTNISRTSPLNRSMELCNIISKSPHNIDIFSESYSSIKTYLLSLYTLYSLHQ